MGGSSKDGAGRADVEIGEKSGVVNVKGNSTKIVADRVVEIEGGLGVTVRGRTVDVKGGKAAITADDVVDVKGVHGVTIAGKVVEVKGVRAKMTADEAVNIEGFQGVTIAGHVVEVRGNTTTTISADDVVAIKGAQEAEISSKFVHVKAENLINIEGANGVTVGSPSGDVVLDSDVVRFSSKALKNGASLDSYASLTLKNCIILTAGEDNSNATHVSFRGVQGSTAKRGNAPENGLWSLAESCNSCIRFGEATTFAKRWGEVKFLLEGIRGAVETVVDGYETVTRNGTTASDDPGLGVECGVVAMARGNGTVVVETDAVFDTFFLITSVRFHKDDPFTSLGGSLTMEVQPGVEYGVACRGTAKETGGGGRLEVAFSAKRVSFSVRF